MPQLYKYFFEGDSFSVTIYVMATSMQEAAKYKDSALDVYTTIPPDYSFSPFAQPDPSARR